MTVEIEKSFYYSQGRVVNGGGNTNEWHDACRGHSTMMAAILCHERFREELAAGKRGIVSKALAAMLAAELGKKPIFECRIVKRTITVEEVEAPLPLEIKAL